LTGTERHTDNVGNFAVADAEKLALRETEPLRGIGICSRKKVRYWVSFFICV
jgi:hypothetical protein